MEDWEVPYGEDPGDPSHIGLDMTDADGADWPPMPINRKTELPDGSYETITMLPYSTVEQAVFEKLYRTRPPVLGQNGNYITELAFYDQLYQNESSPSGRLRRQMLESEADRIVQDRRRQLALDAEVERKLGLIDDFGPDIYADETVLKFRKQFLGSDTQYIYAAITVAGLWYTSGPKGGRYTWDEFIAWLVSGDKPTTQFKQLFD